MVSAALHLAGATTNNSSNAILRIVGLAFVGLLALSCLGALLFSVTMSGLSRLGGESAPKTRRLLARIAVSRNRDTLHQAGDPPDMDAVSSGLAVIRGRDPEFDQIAIVEAARRALFFTFVMQATGERQRIEQVTTEGFWHSPVGVMLQKQGDAQENMREMRERRNAETTNRTAEAGDARVRRGAAITLDFHAGPATFRAVRADEGGLDRVTLRVGYVGYGVVTGSVADAQIAAQKKSSWKRAYDARAGTLANTEPSGLAQLERRGWYDWEFVRPIGSRTDPGDVGRRCHNCGGPFHSDLDSACPSCRLPRATPEGEWLLARSWLVVL